jgi:hypothetical protein
MSSTFGGGMSISNPSATNSPLVIEINGPNNDLMAKPSPSTRTRQSHRTNAKTDLIEVASPQPYNQTTSKKVIQCPDKPVATHQHCQPGSSFCTGSRREPKDAAGSLQRAADAVERLLPHVGSVLGFLCNVKATGQRWHQIGRRGSKCS